VPVPEEQVVPLTAATPVETAPAESIPMEPVPVEAAASAVPAVPVEQAAPVESAAPSAEQAPATEAVAVPVDEFVSVKKGDTLYKIAAQSKQADMSLERMLVALYRANADQFDGRNMNRIRAGKVLHLPTQEEYASVTQQESVKEIHAQAADWNAYRQKLASAAAISGQPQAAQQVVSGKISSSVADKAPVAKESAKEVLKLSKGEAPGDKTATGAGGKSMTAQDKKNAAQEDAIAKAKAAKEGQGRAAMLEKNLQDMKHLAELKSEAAALAAQPPAAAAPPTPEPAKTAEASAAKPKPKEVKPEPSLVDELLSEPLYQAGGAAALLVVAGLGFMAYRRKKKRYDDVIGDEVDDVGSTTGKFVAPVVPSSDTGDFTRTSVTHAVAAPQSEHVDPISEADLFLNFGRDVQAEEILKEALQNTPDNHQIHLKLLGIYVNRKDANSFSTIAGKLQNSGDDDAWQQAVALGRKLDPANPMYGGGGGFRSMEDTGSATMQVKAFNAMPEPEIAPPAQQASALDFDFDAGSTAAHATSSPVDQDAAMDFDITSTNPAIPAAAESTMPVMDDLVFDVTGSHASKPAARQEAEKPADDGGMAFTLDFPTDNIAKPAPAVSAGIGLAGINLNFDDMDAAPGEPATGGKDDHWQEVATKLDLAKAYQEMGDNDGAREILEEVMREGDAGQRDAAQALFD